jgi:hypothetical protein
LLSHQELTFSYQFSYVILLKANQEKLNSKLMYQKIENQVKSNIQTASEWTGMGREIGEAMNGKKKDKGK